MRRGARVHGPQPAASKVRLAGHNRRSRALGGIPVLRPVGLPRLQTVRQWPGSSARVLRPEGVQNSPGVPGCARRDRHPEWAAGRLAPSHHVHAGVGCCPSGAGLQRDLDALDRDDVLRGPAGARPPARTRGLACPGDSGRSLVRVAPAPGQSVQGRRGLAPSLGLRPRNGGRDARRQGALSFVARSPRHRRLRWTPSSASLRL